MSPFSVDFVVFLGYPLVVAIDSKIEFEVGSIYSHFKWRWAPIRPFWGISMSVWSPVYANEIFYNSISGQTSSWFYRICGLEHGHKVYFSVKKVHFLHKKGKNILSLMLLLLSIYLIFLASDIGHHDAITIEQIFVWQSILFNQCCSQNR